LALTFINPMLLRPSQALPRGDQWLYELKFDGFRGLAIKNGKEVQLWSRQRNHMNNRFPRIVEAIQGLPVKSTIIDGEIVCLDQEGRPCFEDLQNYSETKEHFLFFYAFDLLAVNSTTLVNQAIEKRKQQLRDLIPNDGPLRLSDFVDADPDRLVTFAKDNRLEGIVAKRAGSIYEPGKRSGAWTKVKTYQEADFLIGGFLANNDGVESIAVGFHREGEFRYAAKLETYSSRKQRMELGTSLVRHRVDACPFVHVPRRRSGDTWSAGVTAEDLERMVWVMPERTVRVRFIEWTRAGVLRHASFHGIQAHERFTSLKHFPHRNVSKIPLIPATSAALDAERSRHHRQTKMAKVC
jgi:DNA ligase D-like protein (predicted ligase)